MPYNEALCENRHESLESTVAEHGRILLIHDKEISDIKIREAILGTKIDVTNKILTVIAGMIGTAICGVLVAILTHTIKL